MANETSGLLSEHEEFNAKMESAKTEEEAAAIFNDFISSTAGESANSGELSEEQLESVAGGAKWRVARSGVPIFNSPQMPWPQKQRIMGTLGKGTEIVGPLERDKYGNQWVRLRNGGFVNALHVDWKSGSVNSF